MYRRMDAEFVEDVTFPDGSHVQPGTKFVKRWLLMNTGTHAWSASTKVTSICQEPLLEHLFRLYEVNKGVVALKSWHRRAENLPPLKSVY